MGHGCWARGPRWLARGPRVDEDGQGWPRYAEVGRDWPRSAEVGRSWPRFTEIGRDWPRLAEVGRDWPRLSRDPLRESLIRLFLCRDFE